MTSNRRSGGKRFEIEGRTYESYADFGREHDVCPNLTQYRHTQGATTHEELLHGYRSVTIEGIRYGTMLDLCRTHCISYDGARAAYKNGARTLHDLGLKNKNQKVRAKSVKNVIIDDVEYKDLAEFAARHDVDPRLVARNWNNGAKTKKELVKHERSGKINIYNDGELYIKKFGLLAKSSGHEREQRRDHKKLIALNNAFNPSITA